MNDLIERIEAYDFTCEAGPLKNCIDWQDLRALLAENARLKATVQPEVLTDEQIAEISVSVRPDDYYCAGTRVVDFLRYDGAVVRSVLAARIVEAQPVEKSSAEHDRRCKCALSISVLGDGCRYCQPQEYIERLHFQIEEDRKDAATAQPAVAPSPASVPDIDWLAQVIRTVDGGHSLGAGALAEKIVEAMRAAAPVPPAAAVQDEQIAARRSARDAIELGIMRDLLNDPEYEYDVGSDADYCTPTTDKLHALIQQARAAQSAPVPPSVQVPAVTPKHIEEIKDLLLWPVTEDDARTARDMLQSLHFDLSMAEVEGESVQVPDIVPWEDRIGGNPHIIQVHKDIVHSDIQAELSEHRAFMEKLKGKKS